MFLSYDGLKAAIEEAPPDSPWRLRVEPYDPRRLRSASLELHLGSTIARWRHRSHGGHMITTMVPKSLAQINEDDYQITRGLAPGDTVNVDPGEALLMAVDGWVALGTGLIGRVEGKSGIGRCAQLIHTAGWVDPGFVGVLTLEPINFAPFPVVYEVGQPIAQLVIGKLDQPTSRPYGHPELLSRYQGQAEVAPPRPYPPGVLWGGSPAERMPR